MAEVKTQNTMMNIAITVIITVVLVGMVLTPLITDMGNTSGGGTVTITNAGTEGYVLADKDNDVHTIEIYGVDQEMKINIDGVSMDSIVEVVEYNDVTEYYAFLGFWEGYLLYATGWTDDEDGSFDIGWYYYWCGEQGDVPDGMELGYYYDVDSNDSTITLTIQNGIMSAWNGNTNANVSLHITMYRSTTMDNADYVYCTDHAKAPLDADVYVGRLQWLSTTNPNGEGVYSEITLEPACGKIADIIPDSRIVAYDNLGPAVSEDEVEDRFVPTVAEVSSNDYISTVDSFYYDLAWGMNDEDTDSWVIYEPYTYYPGVFVPKTFTYTVESADSGGDAGDDSGGMVKSILMLVPIFIFLGLMVAIVRPIVADRIY